MLPSTVGHGVDTTICILNGIVPHRAIYNGLDFVSFVRTTRKKLLTLTWNSSIKMLDTKQSILDQPLKAKQKISNFTHCLLLLRLVENHTLHNNNYDLLLKMRCEHVRTLIEFGMCVAYASLLLPVKVGIPNEIQLNNVSLNTLMRICVPMKCDSNLESPPLKPVHV